VQITPLGALLVPGIATGSLTGSLPLCLLQWALPMPWHVVPSEFWWPHPATSCTCRLQ
jgi:hypothetical protein